VPVLATKNFWTLRGALGHTNPMVTAAILAGAFGLALPLPVQAGEIRHVAASDDGLTVQFDGFVNKASVFTLSGPNRIAVDIVGATTGHNSDAGGPIGAVRQAHGRKFLGRRA
jgi:N-acetylmuramoyl-L-alanine amidase